jgi:hypothetical protein
VRSLAVYALLSLVACSGIGRVKPPTTGNIAGLARDHDSGDPVSLAEIRISGPNLAPRSTTSGDRGFYDIDKVAPGTYELKATFAGQPIRVTNVVVRAGTVTTVDLMFTLGRPEPIDVDFGNAKDSQIDRYHPKDLAREIGIIEGTVNDSGTRARVVGAVVTVGVGTSDDTEQTVSDDHGRFRFERMLPGIYSVSAYYNVSGRGQIEVRRSGIALEGAEVVVVPLWIEMTR